MEAMALVGAYLIGAIPFGLILTRLVKGVDVRASGSGNIGATNVLRTAGKGLGVATLILDVAKGLVPVLVARRYFHAEPVQAAVGFSAFLGHCYPVYIGFRGGKGVATGLGAIVALSPWVALVAVGVFAVVVAVTRWVSVGSMAGAASIPVAMHVAGASLEVKMITFFMALLIIGRHRENIGRLRRGEEPKLGRKSA